MITSFIHLPKGLWKRMQHSDVTQHCNSSRTLENHLVTENNILDLSPIAEPLINVVPSELIMPLTVITKRPVKPGGHLSNKCCKWGAKKKVPGYQVIKPCLFQRRLLLIYKEHPPTPQSQPSFNSYFHLIPVFSLHIYIDYSYGCIF